LKPRHFLAVRLAVMTMSWIFSSDKHGGGIGRQMGYYFLRASARLSRTGGPQKSIDLDVKNWA